MESLPIPMSEYVNSETASKRSIKQRHKRASGTDTKDVSVCVSYPACWVFATGYKKERRQGSKLSFNIFHSEKGEMFESVPRRTMKFLLTTLAVVGISIIPHPISTSSLRWKREADPFPQSILSSSNPRTVHYDVYDLVSPYQNSFSYPNSRHHPWYARAQAFGGFGRGKREAIGDPHSVLFETPPQSEHYDGHRVSFIIPPPPHQLQHYQIHPWYTHGFGVRGKREAKAYGL
ncbi:unnamed protein product [Cyprideis torosa]|uniref:Uncharacterized protein n=1 Tax=Cyprideis torosa TaxID=163714 RepID=A0A7R8ZLH5_9CRUS|nr:unnamed protein product [Cyprideis torosa]CAG0886745.1 unnamed protein product [Cyprideis torosa]